MNRKPLIALAILATATVAAPALAQDGPNFGVQVGLYLPTNDRIRDAFGDSVFNFGIGPVNGRRPGQGSVTPELNILNANRNGNRLFIGTLTYGYEQHFGVSDNASTLPYARIFAGGSYFDYGVGIGAARQSGRRFGLTGGAEIGVILNQRLRLSARYNTFSRQDGLNFDGITLSATFAVARF